jgi:hypothetical protein
MDVDFLLRMKGALDAVTAEDSGRQQGYAEVYSRIRQEVAFGVDGLPGLQAEFDRLFPASVSAEGRTGGPQDREAIVLMQQLAGWLGGVIDASILERRIRAEAEERAKRTGFA